jgi:hypothetical protein
LSVASVAPSSGRLGPQGARESHGDGEQRDLAGRGIAQHREQQGPGRHAHLPEAGDGALRHLQRDGPDHSHHRRVEAAEQGRDVGSGSVMDVEEREHHHRDPSREHESDVAEQGAGEATEAQAGVRQGVRRGATREHLRDGDGVGELALGHPAALLHQ